MVKESQVVVHGNERVTWALQSKTLWFTVKLLFKINDKFSVRRSFMHGFVHAIKHYRRNIVFSFCFWLGHSSADLNNDLFKYMMHADIN